MATQRLFFASAVLRDGRVFVAGGEKPDPARNDAQIYDPVANRWTTLSSPGWSSISDAPCVVLADGTVLLGSIGTPDSAILDPTPPLGKWTPLPGRISRCDEETWVLLPDKTVISIVCVDALAGTPLKYVPSKGWIQTGPLPGNMIASGSEIGPGILLPPYRPGDPPRAWCIGGTGITAFYQMPASPTDPGNWLPGPTFPQDATHHTMEIKDAPACLLPSGSVLCVAAPYVANDYGRPSFFFEFDGTDTIGAVDGPPAPDYQQCPFEYRMLLLPTGQVMLSNGSGRIYLYQGDAEPQDTWRPTIERCPTDLVRGQSFQLKGRQLNGLSQAVSYGDDASAATNYPLVQFRNIRTDKVWYCRTHDHSTMGVATGADEPTTLFDVPGQADPGPAELKVIANGIASQGLMVTVR